MFFDSLEVFSSIEDLGRSTDRPVFLALGMFDGVHKGHQAVLDCAKKMAGSNGLAVAFTFPEHPASYLRPESSPRLIMDKEGKVNRLLKEGIDGIVLRNFDREFADVEAIHFPAFLIARIPSLSGLCVGENFRFGRGRNGDQELLKKIGKQVGLQIGIVESQMVEQLPVSSSRIRDALSKGCITSVNNMLGRKYEVSAFPSKGKGLGKKIGFPTINLSWNPEARPAFGVYTGWVNITGIDAKQYAIANYGLRPTVEEDAKTPLFEIHLLDGPACDLDSDSKQKYTMELESFLRPEKKFDSLNDLKNQITIDLKTAGELR
jgi:riboflavin kinase/FMN adenylyltransferase